MLCTHCIRHRSFILILNISKNKERDGKIVKGLYL